MNDQHTLPLHYEEIESASRACGFTMPSDSLMGCLLRTLVSSKPGGDFLELGTGTGLSTSWMIEGMTSDATLLSIDNDDALQQIASQHFRDDPRVTFLCTDGGRWIDANADRSFDLIFADTWPGKYDHLDETITMLKPGGIYVVDDMLPQPNWPEGHEQKAIALTRTLEQHPLLTLTKLNWSTGVILATRIA